MASSGKAEPARQKPRHKRRWGKFLVLALALLAVGAYAYLERPWEEKPAEVAVETVEAGPMSQLLAVNGRVVPREEVKVRSAVSAPAIQVNVAEGDEVEAGEVLIQLDVARPQALLDQARAALEAGIVRQQQAQATVDRATALGENASRSTREDAELALTAAATEVSRLRAAVKEAETALAQYSITAPLSGVVLSRSVERGQLVDLQSELFTIADIETLLVDTEVDELYSARIEEGLKVLLLPVGDSVPRHGTVIFAAPRVDTSTGGRTVKIAFDDPVNLPVGLTINANIIVAETDEALSIPRGAIVTEATESHVFVLEGDVVVARAISFSDWPAERVIVTEGLSVGDRVVLDPASVEAGQKVKVE